MRLNNVAFAEEENGATPALITVTMDVREAAAIAYVFGGMNGYALKRLRLGDSSIYECLTGDVFNRYWGDGIKALLPGMCHLDTLNQAIEGQ